MRIFTMLVSLFVVCAIAVSASAQEGKKKGDGKRTRMSAEERFKAMDKDNDGNVTEKEFIDSAKAGPRKMDEAKAKEAYANMGGKDGKLSLETYKAKSEEMRKQWAEKRKKSADDKK
jgi:hypothetical protein